MIGELRSEAEASALDVLDASRPTQQAGRKCVCLQLSSCPSLFICTKLNMRSADGPPSDLAALPCVYLTPSPDAETWLPPSPHLIARVQLPQNGEPAALLNAVDTHGTQESNSHSESVEEMERHVKESGFKESKEPGKNVN